MTNELTYWDTLADAIDDAGDMARVANTTFVVVRDDFMFYVISLVDYVNSTVDATNDTGEHIAAVVKVSGDVLS